MKRSLLSILSLFTLIVALTSCGMLKSHSLLPKPSATDLADHEGSATVALVFDNTENTDDEVSDIKPFCTAVWISDKHILTAGHCMKGLQSRLQDEQDKKEANKPECEGLAKLFGMCDDQTTHKTIGLQDMPVHFVLQNEVTGVSREPSAIHLAKLTGWDLTRDLALIEAVGNAIPTHEYAVVADESPAVTEPVQVVGHPKGLYWTFLTGTVAGYRDTLPHIGGDDVKFMGPYLQIEAPIYFGNSGGGAFNDRGELVGIASFMLRVPDEGFFISVDSMRKFLTAQKFYPSDKPTDKDSTDKK